MFAFTQVKDVKSWMTPEVLSKFNSDSKKNTKEEWYEKIGLGRLLATAQKEKLNERKKKMEARKNSLIENIGLNMIGMTLKMCSENSEI